jgi:uncharacterized membrane protein YeiH/ABC-type nitrate/sulfonate/bicarbonate transport system substrate-binding protein
MYLDKRYWLILLLLAFFTPLHAHAEDSFSLQLKWTPQAQFMGFYVARALGLYENENLDVHILHGGPGINPTTVLRDGRADAIVEWLPTALAEREKGVRLVNVAQIFQHSGLLLVCRRDRGILKAEDIRGKTLSVWYGGNEVPLLHWLNKLNIDTNGGPDGVNIIEQQSVYDDWTRGQADCVSAMSYNEYWTLLERGVSLSDTTIFRFEDLGFGFLEDGIYVEESRLHDPVFADRLTRFLRASLQGWRYALERPYEAVELLLQSEPELNAGHQHRMAEEIVRLVDMQNHPLGLLQIGAYDRTVELLIARMTQGPYLNTNPGHAWTHDMWYKLDPSEDSAFSIEVRYRLQQVLSSNAFYILDLIGTLAFGIAGFARAQERRYDIWGALVLTSLPAVGGGTLRDVLVGGDRSPPFIFTDSNYIYIILAIVIIGSLVNLVSRHPRAVSERFPRLLLAIDTIGLAAFCIIGAKVAIVAELDWFWIPSLAALTCAGGGVLLDIVTGREPQTFRGKIYEEIAIIGGLFLFGMLYMANHVENVERHIVLSIILTFLLVFTTRIFIVRMGWSAPRLYS